MLFDLVQLRQNIRFLINSNIWVAFCVFSLSLSSEILLRTSNFSVSQFVFFSTLFIYNFQRSVRIFKGFNHARKDWLYKNRSVIYFLMFFSLLISSYHFSNFKFNTQIAVLFTAFLSFFYPFGLRNIPYVKIFVISFVWAIGSMLLLLIENEITITQNVILHLASRFLFVFAITVPFDIRDLEHDLGKLKTIPLLLGTKKSKCLANFVILICVCIAGFQYFQNNITVSNLLALILLYILTLALITKSDIKNNDIYFSFWIESLSVFSYLFLTIMLLIV